MSCCACCCFYPKYKRKVDNIYPRSLDAPLVKIEVEKLQYYVKQHPEKLSKVGEYLYQNLKWGLNGTYKNKNYVKNTVEAVDKILLIITPQNLNYYAGNFLKIIQKLLEQGAEPSSVSEGISTGSYNNQDYLDYQKLAATLFRKFCEKEASNQSTTNYNLNYDSFVCQFSSMCYNNNRDERARAEIRSSGLQCLATMVKRLVPDDGLRAGYLWDNMDKIVPALLYIMHENFQAVPMEEQNGEAEENEEENELIEQELNRYLYGDFFAQNRNSKITSPQITINHSDIDNVQIEFRKSENTLNEPNGKHPSGKMSNSSSDETGAMINLSKNRLTSPEVVDPDHEAKMLLKNLASKADYITINKIVVPILTFLDSNKQNGWEHSRFVRCIFLIVMYNVKQTHAIVIKELLKHFDSHINSAPKLKCCMLKAICLCIRISASEPVGNPIQIIELFTHLIKHLKLSVEKSVSLRGQLLSKKTESSTSIQMMTKNNQVNSTDSIYNHAKLNAELNDEQMFQRKVIESMGKCISQMPDYSKNDGFMFITQHINSQPYNYTDLLPTTAQQQQQTTSNQLSKDQLNSQLRAKYFECLYEISTKYKPTQLFSAFTSVVYLENILRLTLVPDWASRRKVNEILYRLLDKYQIVEKVKVLKPSMFIDTSCIVNIKKDPSITGSTLSINKVANQQAARLKTTRNQTYLSQLNLSEMRIKAGREDVLFMRKYGRTLLAHLNESLFLLNNRRENYESLYLTVALLLIGLLNENEFLVDLVRFGFHVQELALLNHDLHSFTFGAQCQIHKFVCAYFLALSKLSGSQEFYEYASEIADSRRRKSLFHYVYPEYVLLEAAAGGMPRVESERASLTEIDTEFRRELDQSAKEYVEYVQAMQQNEKEEGLTDETARKQLSASQKSFKNELKKLPDPKLAPWLFNKKAIIDILENAGYTTTLLQLANSDYSLSVSYLQQFISPLQTALRNRSPY